MDHYIKIPGQYFMLFSTLVTLFNGSEEEVMSNLEVGKKVLKIVLIAILSTFLRKLFGTF